MATNKQVRAIRRDSREKTTNEKRVYQNENEQNRAIRNVRPGIPRKQTMRKVRVALTKNRGGKKRKTQQCETYAPERKQKTGRSGTWHRTSITKLINLRPCKRKQKNTTMRNVRTKTANMEQALLGNEDNNAKRTLRAGKHALRGDKNKKMRNARAGMPGANNQGRKIKKKNALQDDETPDVRDGEKQKKRAPG